MIGGGEIHLDPLGFDEDDSSAISKSSLSKWSPKSSPSRSGISSSSSKSSSSISSELSEFFLLDFVELAHELGLECMEYIFTGTELSSLNFLDGTSSDSSGPLFNTLLNIIFTARMSSRASLMTTFRGGEYLMSSSFSVCHTGDELVTLDGGEMD